MDLSVEVDDLGAFIDIMKDPASYGSLPVDPQSIVAVILPSNSFGRNIHDVAYC